MIKNMDKNTHPKHSHHKDSHHDKPAHEEKSEKPPRVIFKTEVVTDEEIKETPPATETTGHDSKNSGEHTEMKSETKQPEDHTEMKSEEKQSGEETAKPDNESIKTEETTQQDIKKPESESTEITGKEPAAQKEDINDKIIDEKIAEASKKESEVGKEEADVSQTPAAQEKNKFFIEETPLENKNKTIFLVGGIIAGFVIVFSIIFFFFWHKTANQEVVKLQSPEPTPTVVQSTPTPPFQPSKWPLEVLNGSGTAGKAKLVADTLQARGYPVVKIGNADKSNYKTMQLFISKSASESSDLFINDIKSVYASASYSGELKNSTASARVIVGKE